MVFWDDSSYQGPPPPITVYTVLHMSGICSWVCIHVTVASSSHTTIIANIQKNLVSTCLYPESGLGVWVEVWVRDFGGKNKDIEREKEWAALILQPRGEVFISGSWRESLRIPPSSCIMAEFSFSLFSLSLWFIGSWVFKGLSCLKLSLWLTRVRECHLVSRVGCGGVGHFLRCCINNFS